MCTDKTLLEKMRKIKWGDGCMAGRTSGMRRMSVECAVRRGPREGSNGSISEGEGQCRRVRVRGMLVALWRL